MANKSVNIPNAQEIPLLSRQSPLADPEFQRMLQQCIHCGLCLQACPTYAAYGTEMDSPRGRIALMKAASEGRIELGSAFEKHIDLCLACRACETACPSGVQYGALVAQARLALEQAAPPGLIERLIRWLALRQLMPHLPRLRWLARLLRLYQRLGLPRVVRGLRILPGPLKVMEGMLPPLDTRYRDHHLPAPAMDQKRGVVLFFYGCIQEAFLSGVNEATIRVLQRNGYEVRFPLAQTCCGAAALHLGDEDQACRQARQNIDACLQMVEASQAAGDPVLAIINNAGGCGAALKEYPHLLRADPQYAEKARRLASLVMDISEFLIDHLHVIPLGVVSRRVAYSDSCHLRHVQKITRQPRDLLRLIPGLQLVELEKPDRCCGSAGVYNIQQWQTAEVVLDAKMADIDSATADVVVVANTGCYMQHVYGIQRSQNRPRVVHVVELLEESYANKPV